MANEFTEYLKKIQFAKQLKKLSKKLKGKNVAIYGTGILFQEITTNYDLTKFDIIAVSDKKYNEYDENTDCLGYKVVSLKKLKDLKPDYVLVSIIDSIDIIEDLESSIFKDLKTKIIPLVQKPFFDILDEIWGR